MKYNKMKKSLRLFFLYVFTDKKGLEIEAGKECMRKSVCTQTRRVLCLN